MLTCPDCGGIVEIWNDPDFDNVFKAISAECTDCANKWNMFGSPKRMEDE